MHAVSSSTTNSTIHSYTSPSSTHRLPVSSSPTGSISTIFRASTTTPNISHAASSAITSSTKIHLSFSTTAQNNIHPAALALAATASSHTLMTITESKYSNLNSNATKMNKNSPLLPISSIQPVTGSNQVKNQTDHLAPLANSFAIPSSNGLQAHGNLPHADSKDFLNGCVL
jgi:hypothetical protein